MQQCNLFCILLSDVLFTILPGEYHRVKHYLLTQRNLSHDFIGSMKHTFWRRNCKYSCEEPKILVEWLYFVYKFFCSINNPHRDNRKVLVGNHRDIFYNHRDIFYKEIIFLQRNQGNHRDIFYKEIFFYKDIKRHFLQRNHFFTKISSAYNKGYCQTHRIW